MHVCEPVSVCVSVSVGYRWAADRSLCARLRTSRTHQMAAHPLLCGLVLKGGPGNVPQVLVSYKLIEPRQGRQDGDPGTSPRGLLPCPLLGGNAFLLSSGQVEG